METILDFPKQPTTSWIIRTYNEEKWLGKVLEALFSQSRLDFEVIIIDSGSTDKTLAVQETFPIRKLLQIPKEEFNHSKVLNLGIREAWGEYIGILSGHSLPITRTWYEDAMKNFQDNNVAAVTGFYHALPDGSLEEKVGDLHFSLDSLQKQSFCKNMSNTNSIIRKAMWDLYQFDENLPECEDYDWASEMVARGYNIIKDPAFNVYHSHGGIGKKTYVERKEQWEEVIAVIDQKHK